MVLVQKDAKKAPETVQDAPCGALEDVKMLGEGTYGKVYKAIDDRGREYARKVVGSNGRDFDYPSSMRELSALATFQGHPNIIRVFDTTFEQNQCTIVMERMRGDLKKFWEKKSTETRMANIKSIAHQILSAIHFLHSVEIVHRDIKSQNIFYERVGDHIQVKVSLCIFFF